MARWTASLNGGRIHRGQCRFKPRRGRWEARPRTFGGMVSDSHPRTKRSVGRPCGFYDGNQDGPAAATGARWSGRRGRTPGLCHVGSLCVLEAPAAAAPMSLSSRSLAGGGEERWPHDAFGRKQQRTGPAGIMVAPSIGQPQDVERLDLAVCQHQLRALDEGRRDVGR